MLEALIPGSSNLVCGSEDGLWEILALQLALTFEIQLSDPPMLRQNHVQVIDPVIIIQSYQQAKTLCSEVTGDDKIVEHHLFSNVRVHGIAQVSVAL